jgi:hypothetical protein
MYKLTDRRFDATKRIFEKYRQELFANHEFDAHTFERELRGVLDTGYQELKDVMMEIVRKTRLDLPRKTDRYRELAVYYMEHINGPGVVSEFQQPLADVFGVTYFHAPDVAQKRDGYWKNVFAWGGVGDRMPEGTEACNEST